MVTSTPFVQVVAGEMHTIARDSSNAVWGWGYNQYGQVGDMTKRTRNTAVRVKDNDGAYLTGVTAIAAGRHHSLALKSDGTLWSWGYNHDWQLGRGGGYTSSAGQVKDSNFSFLTDVIAVAGGGKHSFAVKSDGTVWSWGRILMVNSE